MNNSSEDAKPPEADTSSIWDPDFWRAHSRLIQLCDHIFEVTGAFGADVQRAAKLGALRTLQFSNVPSRGRRASQSEWLEVETRSQTIWAALSDAQRKRFITTQVPGWLSYVLSVLLILAITSVVAGFLVQTSYWKFPGDLLLPFLTFVVSLGAIGAAASIGMNALSLQEDVSFDISKGKFLWLRLVLGALFGALLTFSWIFPIFQVFISALQETPPNTVDVSADQVKQALWLIVPFVLGFSTSVVILILSRIVESVQTLFGKAQGSATVTKEQ